MVDGPDELDLGTAGASARREHERRRGNREQRTRTRHPVLGGALLALRDAPAHERVWSTGAVGEEATAKRLAERCPRALVLHDRRLPGSRANVDHIAVTPSGVYVIDSKRYKDKKVRVETPLLGKAKLVIGGRDHTKLVDGAIKQVEIVSEIVAGVDPRVRVSGALCFVDADLPLLSAPRIRGIPVLGSKRLAKHINRDGPLSDDEIRAIATEIARRLPPA